MRDFVILTKVCTRDGEKKKETLVGLLLQTREEVLGLVSAAQQRKGVPLSCVQMKEALIVL